MENGSKALSCYAVAGAKETPTRILFCAYHASTRVMKIQVVGKSGKLLTVSRKLLLLMTTLFIAASSPALCQSMNGLYLTKNDFENNVLTLPAKADGDWLKVDLNQDVVLQRDGTVKRFKHHEVYGFFADGHQYIRWGSRRRLFTNAGYYRIVDTTGLIILHTRTHNYKFSADRYVYCKDFSEEMKPLAWRNLSKDFAYHPHFLDTIRSVKKSQLLQITNGMTMLNRLYLQHVKSSEERWSKRIVRFNPQSAKQFKLSNGASSDILISTAFFYQWYGTR